jgi:hypothetical protein
MTSLALAAIFVCFFLAALLPDTARANDAHTRKGE